MHWKLHYVCCKTENFEKKLPKNLWIDIVKTVIYRYPYYSPIRHLHHVACCNSPDFKGIWLFFKYGWWSWAIESQLEVFVFQNGFAKSLWCKPFSVNEGYPFVHQDHCVCDQQIFCHGLPDTCMAVLGKSVVVFAVTSITGHLEGSTFSVAELSSGIKGLLTYVLEPYA